MRTNSLAPLSGWAGMNRLYGQWGMQVGRLWSPDTLLRQWLKGISTCTANLFEGIDFWPIHSWSRLSSDAVSNWVSLLVCSAATIVSELTNVCSPLASTKSAKRAGPEAEALRTQGATGSSLLHETISQEWPSISV